MPAIPMRPWSGALQQRTARALRRLLTCNSVSHWFPLGTEMVHPPKQQVAEQFPSVLQTDFASGQL